MIDDDPSWLDRAPPASRFRVEIAFVLGDKIYTDTSGRDVSEWKSRPIQLPALPRRLPTEVEVREVEGHLSDLIAYYRQGDRPGPQGDTFYWLRLRLGGGVEGQTIGFPYWDTLRDMQPFFDWMARADDGDVFDDLDQGWRVQVARRDDDLFFRHSDWENARDLGLVKTSVTSCRAEAESAMQSARSVVAALKHELGFDPWS